DAIAFCRQLAALPDEKKAGRIYRLPTEAEWEYACRAGTDTPFTYGPELTSSLANFDTGGDGPTRQQTSRVGMYPAKLFGVHDMQGNVWEWCADWFSDVFYRHVPAKDPRGPEIGQLRVARGGSWRNHATACRSAYRNALVPYNRDPATGFRV